MLSLLPCPDVGCDAPAEIIDQIALESTDGPIEHVKICCLRGHAYFTSAPSGTGHCNGVDGPRARAFDLLNHPDPARGSPRRPGRTASGYR
jgi:hypothetical protein